MENVANQMRKLCDDTKPGRAMLSSARRAWPATLSGLSLCLLAWLMSGPLLAEVRVLDRTAYHLRSGNTAEWQQFANRTPHGTRLELKFEARANAGPQTLFIRQQDVKLDWTVQLNGKRLGTLFLMEEPVVHTLAIPGQALREGENTLTILPPKGENDDIVVGEFWLDSRPAAEAVARGWVEVAVRDAERAEPLPCRITVVEAQGALAALRALPMPTNLPPAMLAVRPGVVYAANGSARIGLVPGEYVIYATRGPEYSRAERRVVIAEGKEAQVSLQLRREVPTAGWVSCDTHIHTGTYAKHGDATMAERMVTVAGENLEIPVSTEHNQVIDFREPARALGLERYFTPVLGCEITSRGPHFNAFPIAPGSPAPEHKVTHWPTLMQSMRATPGVRVVTLNHPCDVHNSFTPFAPTNFNAVTGESYLGYDFSFDAMELVNSSALRSDLMETFRGWFALLNYGYRVTGVGGSDGHDVSRFIVGQGRTYIACPDREPGNIPVAEACEQLLRGRAVVSMGLFANMRVNEKYGAGDLATGLNSEVPLEITVLGPSWARADKVELFANGIKVREQALAPVAGVQKANLQWRMARPAHDVHWVVVASGPGVTNLSWAIPRPYQSTSPVWKPRVLVATNPVWVDGDGDGQFTPARGYAGKLVEKAGTNVRSLVGQLAAYDAAVAAQAASRLRQAGTDLRGADVQAALGEAAPAVKNGFQVYLKSLAEAGIPVAQR